MDLHTGTPFWLLRDGLPSTYPPLAEDLDADVAIVGAGITGAITAYELSTIGARVVVLDRRDVATGSSAASSGLLFYDTDSSLPELVAKLGVDKALRVYALGREAIDYLERFCRTAPHECGFRRAPSLYLASRRRDVAKLRHEHALRVEHGFACEWLDGPSLREISTIRAPAAIRSPGDAAVDCYQLTHQFLAAASLRGAAIRDRTAVTKVASRQNEHVLTTDRGHAVRARHLIWATGYEGAGPMTPQATLASTWVLVTEPLAASAGWPDRCLIWETARPYVYVRETDDGRLMIGGEDEPCAECHRSPTWFRRKIRRLERRARRLFPKIDFEIAYAWAGTFSTTDDGLPIIGAHEDRPREWYALGYGGNGITFSVIAAQLLRDAINRRVNPDAEIFAGGLRANVVT